MEELQELSGLQDPQYICDNFENVSYQIFTIICDTSVKSYAAAVYL